jgi:hypothetical protein
LARSLIFVVAFIAAFGWTAGARDYIGSEACAECHVAELAAWTGSYHQLAWTLPSPSTAIGDFDGAVFTHAGVTTRRAEFGDEADFSASGPTLEAKSASGEPSTEGLGPG